MRYKVRLFFVLLNLSKVIGSIEREERLRTRLMATYDIPEVVSFIPILTHAFHRVKPWLLWIVRDHASLRGSCCFPCTVFVE